MIFEQLLGFAVGGYLVVVVLYFEYKNLRQPVQTEPRERRVYLKALSRTGRKL